ncbi:MAG: glutamate--cysteine ligase [Bacteroidetes bacterium]|nr:glutamate--cysteine ligase [Bacteroidota bacterium]
MSHASRLHLFQAYGIELEYMIVDKTTLSVKPISDELLKHELGAYGSDYENGLVTWSNELVAHVIELKSTKPEINFSALENAFADNVKKINSILQQWDAMLMPSAAHPLMDPLSETKLWSHDSNEVYALYDKIFNCKGHGWSNLQSTHLNLPFYDDEEFAKLHAAVRLILPLLPALCASSPILDGKFSGKNDMRLEYYKTNQAKIPSITGRVIPEAVFSKRAYAHEIYDKIKSDVAVYDLKNILDPVWVNSRGAIPRFDRGSIEIRVMDVQECPAADLSIIALVIDLIKAIVNEEFAPLDEQMKIETETLVAVFNETLMHGQLALIDDKNYLAILNLSKPTSVGDVWKKVLQKLISINPALSQWKKPGVDIILEQGTLADRIIQSLDGHYSEENIKNVYRKLSGCLDQNKMFIL